MSNKFKAGDKVVVATLEDLNEHEASNWAIDDSLKTNEVYTVMEDDGNGWVKIKGCKNWHSVHRFELAQPETTSTPTGCKPFNYEEAIKDLSKVVTEFDEEAKIKSIKQIKYSDKLVIETLDDTVYLYNPDGTPACGSTRNLFLKDETVVYVNVSNEFLTMYNYTTLEAAIADRSSEHKSVSMQTISNGEVIKTETVHKY